MVRARRKKEARGSILLSYHSSLVVIKVVLVSFAIIKVVLVSCYMLLRLVSVWSETTVCVCVCVCVAFFLFVSFDRESAPRAGSSCYTE